ncbi:glycosyl hydrolase family 76-domain-containing protein [Boeremia exigua]|uniref:glycosyl hydrolase family 76-domain-containing protein n=1 Tax=Boeremia exigua TaxID=749465 RepID=UPI001E8CAEC1|nr:glycosyl hydrolase family 76-domain-containing protein [Boeremia exigua]KAH6625391.1 glycosyl hydrolase family 76-domain-containing protein [Boeremia exigua]
MYTSILLQSLLFSVPFIPNTAAQSLYDSVTDPTKRAEFALSTLQIWYDAGTGLWDTTGWWNSANVMTMIANLAKNDPNNAQLQNLATRVFANTLLQAPAKNPQPGVENEANRRRDVDPGNGTFVLFNETGTESGYFKSLNPGGNHEPITTFPPDWDADDGQYVDIQSLPSFASESKDEATQVALATTPNPEDWLDGFYDDDLWWALAWIGAYDVTQKIEYLQLAEGIFGQVTKAWPTRCGNGGIFWSWKKDYMNAIANELFLSTAAHLANRAENKDTYVEWAELTLTWFLNSGMINEQGTINDGLTEGCKNNGYNTWSYNQGVILGGLVELNKATPNDTYLPLATKIAKAAIAELSDDNGVIHDGCEPNCGGDGNQFKGVFMRNLQLLHEAAPDDAFADSIRTNADSIWKNNRDEEQGNTLSVVWSGPFVSPANASTHSSAMDALVAAMTL